MNKKYLTVIGIIAAAVIGLTGLIPSTQSSNEKQVSASDKPIVSVSTFTLYEVSRAVAGESLEIRPVIPLGTDAHMFSPNPKQVAEISESALFFYNGAGFERWAEPLARSLSAKTRIVDMSQNVDLIAEEGGHTGDHAGHDHGAIDPHYWLDIDNMIKMTQKIETEFTERFPHDSALYHANAQQYIAQLQDLKTDYLQGLSECENRILVSNHDAFGYLAHANGLENISVIGLSSDEQPNAKNIADIIGLVQKHHIRTIFFEEFINDNIAQTIATETGASAQSLQPLENISEDELKSHQTYLSIMRDNLAKLRDAMECR